MKKLSLEKTIMEQIHAKKIQMKPRSYFIAGSFLMVMGLISFAIAAIFAMSLLFFLLKQHGPMGEWRLQMMIDSFPLWVPLLAIIGISLGVYILKQYDFSYKKNFFMIILGFIVSILLAAIILDYTGLSTIWFRQGPMRRFYNQANSTNSHTPRGQGQRMRYTK
jgi:hypothetical protein